MEAVVSFCIKNQKNPNPHLTYSIYDEIDQDYITIFPSERVSGIDLLT